MTSLLFPTRSNTTAQDVVLLVVRVAVGVVLVAHGWQKFFTYGLSGTAANFEQMGVPLATVSATVAAVIELVGGLLLIVGLVVPLVGALLAVEMIGALVLVHAPNGIFVDAGGYELVLVIAAVGALFAVFGAGSYSLDRVLAANRKAPIAA